MQDLTSSTKPKERKRSWLFWSNPTGEGIFQCESSHKTNESLLVMPVSQNPRPFTARSMSKIEYSLIQRTPERELLPVAHTLDIGVAAWSPLASGWLTGKYTKGNSTGEERRLDSEMMEGFVDKSDRNTKIAQTVDKVAEQIGTSSSQVALAWLLSKGVMPIVGARKVSHIEDNLKSVDLQLSLEQIQQLDEVSKIELGFPHNFFNADMVRNFVYNGTFDKINNHRYSQLAH